MKIKPVILLGAALCVVSSAVCSTPVAAISQVAAADFVPSAVLVVVPPARLPWEYDRTAIDLKLVVDERGYPRDVEIVDRVPTELRELVISAVEQWRFSPATRHGTPVKSSVLLPLKLVAN